MAAPLPRARAAGVALPPRLLAYALGFVGPDGLRTLRLADRGWRAAATAALARHYAARLLAEWRMPALAGFAAGPAAAAALARLLTAQPPFAYRLAVVADAASVAAAARAALADAGGQPTTGDAERAVTRAALALLPDLASADPGRREIARRSAALAARRLDAPAPLVPRVLACYLRPPLPPPPYHLRPPIRPPLRPPPHRPGPPARPSPPRHPAPPLAAAACPGDPPWLVEILLHDVGADPRNADPLWLPDPIVCELTGATVTASRFRPRAAPPRAAWDIDDLLV